MSKDTKALVVEMSAGVLLYGLAAGALTAVVCLAGGYRLLPCLLGLLAGIAASILMLVHMAVITERVLESGDAAYATRTTVIHALLRKLAFIVAIVAVWLLPGVEVLTMILGAFGLKAGAYLQPQIHKAIQLRKKGG